MKSHFSLHSYTKVKLLQGKLRLFLYFCASYFLLDGAKNNMTGQVETGHGVPLPHGDLATQCGHHDNITT